jgi:23S rRNA pseudouridine2605 synthase
MLALGMPPPRAESTMLERIQKILARAGYGSRRACEHLVEAGRVRVNGRVATLGQKADPAVDVISLDGTRLKPSEAPTYIALYKPRNVVSSVRDPAGRKTVTDLVRGQHHLYPVGRLDWDSEGLVLMTNDGELTNRLTHPRYGHTKEYRVLLARRPDREQLATWRRGLTLSDGHRTLPADVSIESDAGKGAWLRITMGEGHKRQIREIGSLLGLPVVRIVRIRIGSLYLGALKPGEWRYLAESEVRALQGGDQERVKRSAPRAKKPRSGTP